MGTSSAAVPAVAMRISGRAGAPPQPGSWLGRWRGITADLVRPQYTHPMVDAVIDEIDGRMIRIGEEWLSDFASCNYLGLDLDPEIIDAIPSYLQRWGTHPSWSRLLGSPRLYEEIEERLRAVTAQGSSRSRTTTSTSSQSCSRRTSRDRA